MSMVMNIWLKVIMAAVLSLLMVMTLGSCSDSEKKTEAPSEIVTEAPTSNSGEDEDEAADFVLEGTAGLSYATNSAGTTCYLSGLGTFTGDKLVIPEKILGVNGKVQTVIGIQEGALDGKVAASLKEIDIPESVKKLPAGLFDQCEKLTTIRFFGEDYLWDSMIKNEDGDVVVPVPENATVLFCEYYDLTVQYVYMDGTAERKDKVTSHINGTVCPITVPKHAGYRADADYLEVVMDEDITVTVTYTKILAEGRCGDHLTWTYYEDNRLDVQGSGEMYDYIESTVPWSLYSTSISDIRIGENVESIGAYAFAGCTAVEHVLLPEKLKTVGAYAFRGWSDTQTIEFCGGVDILTTMDAVWNSDVKANICFRYGSYEQDNDLTNGKEPLVWTLVEQDNGAYLLTLLYAIELKPYHNQPVDVTWENSDLRAWLSGEFANEAFTEDEWAAQVTMRKGIGTAQDKLFIFTAAELASLFAEEELRIRPATAYANPVEIEVENEDGTVSTVIGASEEGVYWWLRDGSVLGYGMLAQDVSPEGITNSDGTLVSTANRGVVISVWVDPSQK